jgi:hypothetical protein
LPRSAAEGGNSSSRIAASIASGLKMHVPLRRAEVGMAGEFLHGSRGRAAHREVRAERVSEEVRSRVPRLATGCEPCLARRALEQAREHVGPEGLTVLLTQHACALQVPMPL